MSVISRREVLSQLLLGLGLYPRAALGISHAATVGSRRDAIAFDGKGLGLILRWAESREAAPQPDWRNLPAYDLARQQAHWSGQSNSDSYVEQQLARVEAQKRQHTKMPQIEAARRLADQVTHESRHFLSWAVPHLHSYLPSKTPIRGTVALAAFLRNYAFSMKGTIVVSLTDGFWQGSPARVFNLLVHELFHNGFIEHQRGEAPGDAADGAALLRNFLWSLQNEGMATYVAYTKSAGLDLEDYRLLQNPAEVRKRFDLSQAFIEELSRAPSDSLAPLRERLWKLGATDRATYVVGAAMAQRIERSLGRARLVASVANGPADFVDAYRQTRPAEDLI